MTTPGPAAAEPPADRKIGVHLPQHGRASTEAGSVTRAAGHAEELAQGRPHDVIRAQLDADAEAGVTFVVCAPWRSGLDAWLRSMDRLAELTGRP